MTMMAGVFPAWAAKARRRAAATLQRAGSRSRMTPLNDPDLRASSAVHSTACCVRSATVRIRAAGIPMASRPGPWSPPASIPMRARRHHSRGRPSSPSASSRRLPSAAAKPIAAATSPACRGAISCSPSAARPSAGSRASISESPSRHGVAGAIPAVSATSPGRSPSSRQIRCRKVSTSACLAQELSAMSVACRYSSVMDAGSAAGSCAGVLAMMRSLNVAILF